MREFRSRHHPGDDSAALVYGRAVARPIGACVVPLMIGATMSVLQSQDPLPYLTMGLPGAVALALTWTRFRLGSTPAALQIRGPQVAILSVRDVLRDAEPNWQPLFDVRVAPDAIHVTLGHDADTLRHTEWPEQDALADALRHARARPADPSTSRSPMSSPTNG